MHLVTAMYNDLEATMYSPRDEGFGVDLTDYSKKQAIHRAVVTAIAASFNALTVRFPGFGEFEDPSTPTHWTADDVEQLIEAVNAERA